MYIVLSALDSDIPIDPAFDYCYENDMQFYQDALHAVATYAKFACRTIVAVNPILSTANNLEIIITGKDCTEKKSDKGMAVISIVCQAGEITGTIRAADELCDNIDVACLVFKKVGGASGLGEFLEDCKETADSLMRCYK